MLSPSTLCTHTWGWSDVADCLGSSSPLPESLRFSLRSLPRSLPLPLSSDTSFELKASTSSEYLGEQALGLKKKKLENYVKAHKCFCRKQTENRHDSPSSALNFLTLIKFIPMSFSVLPVVKSKQHLHRLNLFQFHWALVEQGNSHNFAQETLVTVHSSKYSTCIVPPTCESWPLDLCMDWGFGSSISAQGVLPLTPAGSLGYQPELCSRRWSFPP